MLRLISTRLECIPIYTRLLLGSQFSRLDMSPSLSGQGASSGRWTLVDALAPRDRRPKHQLFQQPSACFPFDQRLPFLLIFQITDACQRINYLDRCSADSGTSCGVHRGGPGILPA